MDQWQAYGHFEMDHVIYMAAKPIYNQKDLANWQVKTIDFGVDSDGNHNFLDEIETPGGSLTNKYASNVYTQWQTKHIIESERDWEIWAKYYPVPIKIDQQPWIEAKKKLGDKGILRAWLFNFGQGSPWQSFAGCLHDMQKAIIATYDKPAWVHAILEGMNNKLISLWERTGKMEVDIVETGGGAGSSTVISPKIHEEFCLPYDQAQHKALKECCGVKVAYHLCGGIMPLLELVVQNGADGLETMTPDGMGGDCDLAEASKRVGDKLFFIGGFDQRMGFENGTQETVRQMVLDCFEATKDYAGYICSPSDHFFNGNPELIQAFVDACKECKY